MPSMVRRCALLSVLAVEFFTSALGVTLPFEAHLRKHTKTLGHMRRDVGQSSQVTISDFSNVQYSSTITVGGAQFNVLLDTGSSDLNIFGAVPSTQDTQIPVNVSFAQGSDAGVMSFTTVTFSGATVQDQIYNHISTPNPSPGGTEGLLGLGPSEGSVLHAEATSLIANGQLPANGGDSFLDRTFQQNTSSPNFMTFYLSREDSNSSTSMAGSGVFTIGEVLQANNAVTSMPKLPVLTASISAGQHWTVLLDGAIGNNGNMVTLAPSIVPGTTTGKLVTIFDSGFSLPQVPQEITNAFYSSIPNSMLMDIDGLGPVWTMPCNQPVQGAFVFGGQTYPVHPLDLNADPNFIGLELPSGTCFGFFQPIQEDAIQAIGGLADMILGMAFLRNVYTLMNFGDFVDASADATMQPYVQLLSVTNQTAALTEFRTTRSNGALGSANGRAGVFFGLAAAALAVMSSL